jgi:hypothetical protein
MQLASCVLSIDPPSARLLTRPTPGGLQLVLHTREFARLAVIHFPSYALRHKAMAYVSAFAWCLKARVRLGDRPEVYVSELLGCVHAPQHPAPLVG